MKNCFWLLGLFALLFSPVTYAQQYAGVGLGQTSADVSSAGAAAGRDAVLAAGGFSCADPGITCSESTDDSDTVFKVFFGNRINSNFAVEGFYTDLGSYSATAQATDASGTFRVRGDIDGSAFGASAIGFLPLDGGLSLLAKGGLAWWSVDATATADFTDDTGTTVLATESADDDGTDLTYGVGVQWDGGNYAVRAEYEVYTNIGLITLDEGRDGDIDILSVSAIFRF